MPSVVADENDAVREFQRNWLILVACVVGLAFSVSASVYSVGIFIKPLIAEYGFKRSELAVGLSLNAVTFSIMPLLVGFVVDRFGEKLLAPLSILGIAVIYALGSQLPGDVRVFWIGYALVPVIGAFSSTLVFSRIISLRFQHGRGTALAVALMGLGVASMVMPGALGYVVAKFGWRIGFLALGAATALAAIPVALALWTEPKSNVPNRAKALTDPAVAAAERQRFFVALRQPELWVMAAAFFLIMLGAVGIVPHFVPLLTDRGMPAEKAAIFAGLIGAFMIVGRFVTGVLIDRLFAPYVAAVTMAVCAGCLATLALGGPAAVGALGVGLSIGAELDLAGYMVARYFPSGIFGRVYGVIYAAIAFSGIPAALIVGIWYEKAGSYGPPLLGSASAILLAALLFLLLPKYPQSR